MNSIKRIWGVIWLLPFIIYITGCASTRKSIPVQIQKPAEITLPGIKILAVADFGVGPEIDSRVGSEVARKLRAKLVQNGYYNLIEDWRVKQALAEHGVEKIEQLDAQQYQAIGKSLEVDGLLFGTVGIYFHQDAGGPRTTRKRVKEGDKSVTKTIKSYVMTRTANVQVTFRVVDAKTGLVLASLARTVEEKDTDAQPIQETEVKNLFSLSALKKAKQLLGKEVSDEEKARNMAIENLMPATVLFDQAIDKLAQQITETIAPYISDEKRILEAGGHKLITSGYDLALLDLWDDAKEAWETVIEDEKTTKVHPKAWYNIGIYHELKGDLDEADKCFSKAHKIKDDKLYLNARGRIKARQKELAKLEEQAM
ncbi:MAG: tetratricopeptide repeat protein [Candidatus Marinimicrobia bacterium]|nr:tetratricopeptide repeat protein [Candidatus Neomarinimicrobiota bacterium]